MNLHSFLIPRPLSFLMGAALLLTLAAQPALAQRHYVRGTYGPSVDVAPAEAVITGYQHVWEPTPRRVLLTAADSAAEQARRQNIERIKVEDALIAQQELAAAERARQSAAAVPTFRPTPSPSTYGARRALRKEQRAQRKQIHKQYRWTVR